MLTLVGVFSGTVIAPCYYSDYLFSIVAKIGAHCKATSGGGKQSIPILAVSLA
jgi:hypothetical protein